jgi:hypothetical protein
MRDDCEVVAYVRSRRVAVEARRVRVPVGVSLGVRAHTAVENRTFVRYARTLDSLQSRALSEAHRVAEGYGHAVRVVDLGRVHPLLRGLRSLFLRSKAFPVVVWRGPCFRALRGNADGSSRGASSGVRT